MMNRRLAGAFAFIFILLFLVAFRSGADGIAVVSREEGSGARDSFEQLMKVNTQAFINEMRTDALIQNGNGIVATTVANNPNAIGYTSFSIFLERKADLTGLFVDGVAPTKENMLNGAYNLVRPFNIVYRPENVGIAEQAFLSFIGSRQGLEILNEFGTIVDTTLSRNFDSNLWDLPANSVAFGGSTSTEASALALMEEFRNYFPHIELTYEAVGSVGGIVGATNGLFSLGFASRDIRESELEKGLEVKTYCLDGIVLVVHPDNPLTGLSTGQIRDIFLGNVNYWVEVND